MQAKIISFDEVLERMKTGNIKNICIVDFFNGYIKNLSTAEVGSLVRDREDSIFIHAELDSD